MYIADSVFYRRAKVFLISCQIFNVVLGISFELVLEIGAFSFLAQVLLARISLGYRTSRRCCSQIKVFLFQPFKSNRKNWKIEEGITWIISIKKRGCILKPWLWVLED